MTLSGKKILIGITGGIAAYKIYELIRRLVKLNADVKTVITPAAKEFITETVLRTLTKNPVYCEQFGNFETKPEHISLADEADLFIIAPASANTVGKISCGICDNLLTSVVAAFNNPVIIAPAMNCNMWSNPAIRENITKLEKFGFHIINPEFGELACGYEGQGRLAEIDVILEKISEMLIEERFLHNKRIIITAGGTKEPLDPVRFIGNKSSGKTGIALADAAYAFGAEVCLITTVKTNKPYKVINISATAEMLETVKTEFVSADILIMAAAPADFRVKNVSGSKIKKTDKEILTLELVKNPDILKEIAKIKKENQTVIGFCAESNDLIANAKNKITDKSLDFIVANDISDKEIGFDVDYNAVTIIDKDMNEIYIDKMLKTELAKVILKKVFNG